MFQSGIEGFDRKSLSHADTVEKNSLPTKEIIAQVEFCKERQTDRYRDRHTDKHAYTKEKKTAFQQIDIKMDRQKDITTIHILGKD